MTSTVLLYQHDQSIRDLVFEVLTDAGHPVIACDSLAEVQARSRMDPTALALIDAWGASYGALIESERQDICAFTAEVPSVMLTARSWSQAVSADELGLLALLEKPMGLDQLVETVGQHVTRLRHQGRAAREQSRQLARRSTMVLARLRDARERLDGLQPQREGPADGSRPA